METKLFTCLNGRFVRADRAAVSVADRGFRFGDGVFETMRIARGVPYQWEAHVARLEAGLQAIGIASPDIDWAMHARALLRKNKAIDGTLRLAITRGAGSRGYQAYPPGMPVHWVMEYHPSLPLPDHAFRLFLSAVAKIPRVCLPVNSKLAQGLNSTLALQEAITQDCHEALQLTVDGLLCEAASANLFWWKNGALHTPSLETGCLAGTTREAVIRLSLWPVKLVAEGLSSLESAKAVFLTNTRLGVWPVASLQPLGWRFNAQHSIIGQMQSLLKHDRAAYVTKHRYAWA